MLSFLSRRGPDMSSDACIEIDLHQTPLSSGILSDSESVTSILSSVKRIHLSGHVLWTQGPEPIAQPYINSDETKYLLFNGDIYSFSGKSAVEDEDTFHPDRANDGLILFEKLQEASDCDDVDKFIATISNLRGPFAFVYFDKVKNKIWFGRDFFGRESLLFSFCDDELERNGAEIFWNISSVSVYDKVFEIPTAGLYEFDINTREISLIPYACHARQNVLENVKEFSKFLESVGLSSRFERTDGDDKLINLRFCTMLKSPCDESCDILSRLTLLASRDTLSPGEVLIEATNILNNYVTKFIDVLRRSVRLRMKAVSPLCRDHGCSWKDDKICRNNTVGVLFSGGLDSSILAYLAAEANDGNGLELVNVAFSKNDCYNNIPDRETALESFNVLKKIFQGKSIRLILANGRKDEVEEMRRERVKDLIVPLKSVLDDSLGCCLWFAARGHGIVAEGSSTYVEEHRNSVYKSPVRTVLLGSGADELLGGYGRHRSAYKKSGWKGLGSEMQLDIDRISIRNLGRDNRVVSDHEVCPRMPFLDEGVVNFLTQDCDLWVKCCPLLGDRGLGEKLLLRAAAVKLFGEENVHIAMFPKRAMQFGSRIAKLENSKEKGGDTCDRLK